MKAFLAAGLFLSCMLLSNAGNANGEGSCRDHCEDICSEPGSEWSSGVCNALHGGFKGNSNNLHQFMSSHFKDSFKFLLMSSHFNTDEVNRMGMHKLLRGYSDKMWENGKSIMKFILNRGGKISSQFRVSDMGTMEAMGEVGSLATALDLMKREAENAIVVYKHAMNKKHFADGASLNAFDPATVHFLEEDFIEAYAEDIRQLSGNLNVLAKMARVDESKALALHLFDQSLL